MARTRCPAAPFDPDHSSDSGLNVIPEVDALKALAGLESPSVASPLPHSLERNESHDDLGRRHSRQFR